MCLINFNKGEDDERCLKFSNILKWNKENYWRVVWKYITLWQQNRESPIRVITKLPNTKQSSKGKGKTHMSQQTGKIRKQPENWENRNGPDLVQAFPKKWWVESDFTAPYLPLPLRLKGSGRHYNSIFNNTVLKNIIHLGQRPPKFRGPRLQPIEPIGKSGTGFIYYIAFRHCLNVSENNTPPTVLTISLLYYI